MKELQDRVALVTGASGGIGAAIATALGQRGAQLLLIGRDQKRLNQTAVRASISGQPTPEKFAIDLTKDDDLTALSATIAQRFGVLDILVHSAGEYERGKTAEMPIAQLDRQYQANLRAPYLLTQLLLPLVSRKGGDIVFINSTQGITAGPDVGAYAATQHGMKALADSLRSEINDAGVRVLSVFLGRTATARQERVFLAEGRPYVPDNLLRPEAVAEMVATALCLERSAEVVSMTLRPSLKSY